MAQSNTEIYHEPLSDREKWLAQQIVNIAYTIHKQLGPGLLESVYEKCFCYELSKRGIAFQRQCASPIKYDNLIFE